VPTPENRPRDLARGITRRSALVTTLVTTLAGTLAAGCSQQEVVSPSRLPRPTQSPGIDPDVALAAQALESEQAMLAAVAATASRHGRLRPVLASPLSAHEQHVRLLNRAVPAEARTSPSPSGSVTASVPSGNPSAASPSAGSPSAASPSAASPSAASPSAGPGHEPKVPADPGRALLALAQHEDRLSLDARRNAFAAGSGSFARLLASMAAAAAQQAAVLRARAGG
jgi:hypothetical protein